MCAHRAAVEPRQQRNAHMQATSHRHGEFRGLYDQRLAFNNRVSGETIAVRHEAAVVPRANSCNPGMEHRPVDLPAGDDELDDRQRERSGERPVRS